MFRINETDIYYFHFCRIYVGIIFGYKPNPKSFGSLARLYFQNNQIELSEKYFEMISDNDSTDVEAYLGLAEIEKKREHFERAIYFYKSALKYLPQYFPALFDLAQVYIYSDQLDSAIATYKKILSFDDTWAEAWAEIGKILWWKDRPFEALGYYKKALVLDPTNKEIIAGIEQVKNDLKWRISAKSFYIREKEEDYEIKSKNQKFAVAKRISDKLDFSLNGFVQFGEKTETATNNIIKKMYDSNSLNIRFKIFRNNELHLNFGGSFSDSTVRRNYLENKLSIKWKKFVLNNFYQTGKVEKNWIWNKTVKNENPFVTYDFNLNYRVFSLPKIKIGINHTFIDYQYDSTLYYTPSNRHINGFETSLYYPFKPFYLYSAVYGEIDNNNDAGWRLDLEAGYEFSRFSLALSFSDFKNPYYESNSLSLIFGGNF
ncbi:MAG: hypothetical protein B6D62_02800 [Candidatus Cloacimonas sp. 4484_275]|nr:MAG: hypothetical protein B6D62_02800 [Candidatus Cloacimonas sp. 4484_275]